MKLRRKVLWSFFFGGMLLIARPLGLLVESWRMAYHIGRLDAIDLHREAMREYT